MNRLAETTHNTYSYITDNWMKVWVISLGQIYLHLILLFYRIFIDPMIHYMKRGNVKVIAVLRNSSECIYLLLSSSASIPSVPSSSHLRTMHFFQVLKSYKNRTKNLDDHQKSAWQSFRCQVLCNMWSAYVSKILTSLSFCTN